MMAMSGGGGGGVGWVNILFLLCICSFNTTGSKLVLLLILLLLQQQLLPILNSTTTTTTTTTITTTTTTTTTSTTISSSPFFYYYYCHLLNTRTLPHTPRLLEYPLHLDGCRFSFSLNNYLHALFGVHGAWAPPRAGPDSGSTLAIHHESQASQSTCLYSSIKCFLSFNSFLSYFPYLCSPAFSFYLFSLSFPYRFFFSFLRIFF